MINFDVCFQMPNCGYEILLIMLHDDYFLSWFVLPALFTRKTWALFTRQQVKELSKW